MNSTHHRAARRPIIALAVLACAGLFAAAPARAGGEFRDGFEDQLGRLAAFQVFHIGSLLLHGHPGPYYGRHIVPRHRHHHHGHPGRHLGHHRGHHRGAPCALEHARVYRGPRGHVETVEHHVYRRRVDHGHRGGY